MNDTKIDSETLRLRVITTKGISVVTKLMNDPVGFESTHEVSTRPIKQ